MKKRFVPLWLLVAWVANAHAILLKTNPAANSVISGHSITFSLTFNSRIDGRRSRLTLVCPDSSERRLDLDAQRPADTLAANAKDLTPGLYRLRWQVLALDGHITRGEIPFRVEPPKP